MSEPTDVDSVKDLAATPGDRAMYFHWKAEESDVELCTHRASPSGTAQELDVGTPTLADYMSSGCTCWDGLLRQSVRD